MDEKLEVKFKSKLSSADNCFCTCCHDTGRVTKVRLPETKFHNGRNLTAKYQEYWLCEECRNKLMNALNNPEVEK